MRGAARAGLVLAALLPFAAAAEALPALSVAQYMRLQAQSETDDQSAVFVGAYVAGLFTGIDSANASLPPEERYYCRPPDVPGSLSELLGLIDEAVAPYRETPEDAEAEQLQDVLLNTLMVRFPCTALGSY